MTVTPATLARIAARHGYALSLRPGTDAEPQLTRVRGSARLPADLMALFRENRGAVVRWLRGEPDVCGECGSRVFVPDAVGLVCDWKVKYDRFRGRQPRCPYYADPDAEAGGSEGES